MLPLSILKNTSIENSPEEEIRNVGNRRWYNPQLAHLSKLTFPSRSIAMSYYTNHRCLNKAIRKTFIEMELNEAKEPHDRVGISWVTHFNSTLKFIRYQRLVNHISREFYLTDKLQLAGLVRAKMPLDYQYKDGVYQMGSTFPKHPEFIPPTYDMSSPTAKRQLLIEANEGDVWIVKPADLNRGRGIKIIYEFSTLKKLIENRPPGRFLVQRYIKNPLLINSKKFDIRSYLSIVATKPLLCFHDPGYVRISLYDYKLDENRNSVHLTNQCIQQRENDYENKKEDTVWTIEQLNNYLNSNATNHPKFKPDWALNELQETQRKILKVVVESAESKIAHVNGQFGLYGCDFMIDQDFNVYLIEINLGPALQTNTSALASVIPRVLNETIKLATECYDKKNCGMDYLPLIKESSMKLVYIGIYKPNANLPGPYNIERHLRNLQLVGKYPVDLKRKAIEKCLEKVENRE
ncbi:hypothetical protein ACOME3_006028 [Neoechinorhynchus agilis]